ncbi:MAG: NAD(P)-dependent oxidoreductase, partial [Pseudomonadota bacterium]
MSERVVGIIGASSLVGDCLLPLLVQSKVGVVAWSRRAVTGCDFGVEWRVLNSSAEMDSRGDTVRPISDWIIVAPIWVIPEHFALLEACGARRVVALSSTSRFVKDNSSDAGEQRVAARLAEGEAALQSWAELRGVEWLVLRPTLIYGRGRDQNIA